MPNNAKLVSKPPSINSRNLSAIGRKKTDYTAAMNATAINEEDRNTSEVFPIEEEESYF